MATAPSHPGARRAADPSAQIAGTTDRACLSSTSYQATSVVLSHLRCTVQAGSRWILSHLQGRQFSASVSSELMLLSWESHLCSIGVR